MENVFICEPNPIRLCSFTFPGGVLCGQPALRDSASGRCRFHRDAPRRASNIARAQAEKHLLPGRRLVKSATDLRARHLRNFKAMGSNAFSSYQNCHLVLNNILNAYGAGVFDAQRTSVMLGCLRIAATNLRHSPELQNSASTLADHRGFILRVRDAVEALRIDCKLEKLAKPQKLQRNAIS